MELREIADIQAGFTFGTKQAQYPNRGYFYRMLTGEALMRSGNIDLQKVSAFYATERLPNKYITHQGDIIIHRMPPYTMTYITDIYENFLVPNEFAIIRVTSEEVLPLYVAWNIFRKRIHPDGEIRPADGKMILLLNEISAMDIPMVSLDRQKELGSFYEYYQDEAKLMEKLKTNDNACYGIMLSEFHDFD